MKRRAIQVICLWAIMLSVGPLTHAVEFAGGTGEPNDPFLIATTEQFLGADFSRAGVHYRLSSDIDLEEVVIASKSDLVFRASLDGAGYRILHPTIRAPGSLFGRIEAQASITNLIVDDVGFELDFPGFWYTGALASENYGVISNCGVRGWVGEREGRTMGGLVGSNRGCMRDCYFEGLVMTDWPELALGEFDTLGIGGLAGDNEGLISGCYAAGVVSANRLAGGLVGYNDGLIIACYAMTTVMTDSGGGGLVGVNGGTLTRCYAAGWVTGEMRGGLVGLSDWNTKGSVVSCLWEKGDCLTSGGGIGVSSLGRASRFIFAENGWTGDPNWVIVDSFPSWENYPRLAWEGIDGNAVTELPVRWAYVEGSGTESDPYVIQNPSGLQLLCQASVLWDKHFVLATDLDMAHYSSSFPISFSPIGVCRGSAFSGTFDGNGHTIRNVTIDVNDATAWHLGVFGYITGQVKNLTVENVRFVSGQKSRCVGLLAGTCEGLIENCRASGSITVGENSQYIGGLVGYLNRIVHGDVIDCEADTTIEAGEGSTDVGELIGFTAVKGR